METQYDTEGTVIRDYELNLPCRVLSYEVEDVVPLVKSEVWKRRESIISSGMCVGNRSAVESKMSLSLFTCVFETVSASHEPWGHNEKKGTIDEAIKISIFVYGPGQQLNSLRSWYQQPRGPHQEPEIQAVHVGEVLVENNIDGVSVPEIVLNPYPRGDGNSPEADHLDEGKMIEQAVARRLGASRKTKTTRFWERDRCN